MKRRAFLPLLAVAIALGGQVRADAPVDRILRDLKRLGYDNISVEQTLLRRTRIFATSAEAQREIILNPNTGEILRDLWIPINKASSSGNLVGSDADDGDDDDDDDDDGDDDNSGHGGDDGGDDGGGDDGGDDNGGSGGDDGDGGGKGRGRGGNDD